jgi:cobalt-zinc-cadmium efflux system protein
MSHRRHERAETGNERRLFWAMCLTFGFMFVEAAGGAIAGSLALLADAGHMLTDAASLLLAWLAFRMGRRPSDEHRSYGYARLQVLAAFVNGLALLLLVVWLFVEAVMRLVEPVAVAGQTMLIVAALGLAVNGIVFGMLHGGDRRNLNLQGALAHVLGDLASSAAAVTAALVILSTGWNPADPLLSIVVAVLIARTALRLLARSVHVLLEGTPEGFDVEGLKRAVGRDVPGVAEVHHVHLWALTAEHPLLTLHARVESGADHDHILHGIQDVLARKFGIDHATVQIETGPCPDGGAALVAPAARAEGS